MMSLVENPSGEFGNKMTITDLAIAYETPDEYSRAKILAEQLHLPVHNEAPRRLIVAADKLMLKIEPFSPLFADFTIQTWQSRRDAGKQQGLVRAIKPCSGMKIIDATGGWGRDAAVLASFGAEVLLLERNPVMAALLADALARQDERSQSVLQIKLLCTDSIEYLSALPAADCPEIIYLDPMHPLRQKEALVKRELQVLQQLIGPDPDIALLLAVAKEKANRQVVMKWPQRLPVIDKPTRIIEGKTVQFALYGAPSSPTN